MMRSAPAVAVQLLGAARATFGGSAHPFSADKRYQLLAYLAHRGDWVSREELIGLFWPDNLPEEARNNLRQLLSRVRAMGGAPGLEVERERLRWLVDTDLAAFDHAVAEERWAEALNLHKGALLAGLDAEGAGGFAAWLELERERLRDRWRAVLLRRAEDLTAAGAHLEAAELLRALLAGDELDEAALAAYAGALVRAGQRERALLAYAAFVNRLRDELGLAPTAELEQLGRALRGGGAPPAPPEGAAARDLTRHAPFLPEAATSFVGRDLELAEINRLLSRPDCRLLTLCGPGGVGKTRLALESARELAPSHRDGVHFVSLVALTDGALIPQSLADGLGLTLQGQGEPLEGVIRFVGHRSMLIVLDNFEHLLDGKGVAQELVARCPNLRLIVTSRERLALEAEWLLPVEGLDHPPEGEPAASEGRYFDAVQLFLERARRVRPDFALGEENLPHLLAICRLVEGSPLALELAAVWVRSLPLEEVSRQIEESLDFLGSRGGGRAKRHASLRAVFEHSWRLLTKAEQETFRKLSVFRGGFRLEAARHVAGASLPVLAALVDKSLLRLGQTGRYDRHALIYQYARELLAERPEEEAGARERHGRYYLAFLAERSEEIRGPRGGAALAALDEELENVRAAWRWAVEGKGLEEPTRARASSALSLYHDRRTRYQEGLAMYAEAAALAEADPARRLALDEALVRQAWFGMRLGRYDEARRLAERGLALTPPGGVSAMHAQNTLGVVALRTGAYAEAERRFAAALALAERHGLEAVRGDLVWNLAIVEAAQGRYGEAQEHNDQALALYRRLDSRLGMVGGLQLQGSLALAAGRLAEAQALFERGLGLAQALGFHQLTAPVLKGLAEVALARGAFSEARRLGEEALSAARASAARTSELGILNVLGRASVALGDEGRARTHLERALGLARSSDETPMLLEGLVSLAQWRLARSEAQAAAPLVCLALRHPAASHRLKTLAGNLERELRDHLSPEELSLAEARGEPERLEALADEALTELDAAPCS